MTAPAPSLVDALRERYEISGELGRGGMATVYLALDRRHHRQVAVKVLRPDLAASIGSERFLKEIEISARLTHPHILPLYDSGNVVGPAGGLASGSEVLYYVMPYVEGGSLRQRLIDQRRVGTAEALRIAEPVADALGYAHRMGFFHRDIKPENILFSQGHPVVADFGIAKAISTAGGANLTRTGFPLGTPGYMSPEQAAGLTELDERTDVYSLAVVIYEMVVGEIPGRWPTEEEVRAGRFLSASASHRSRLGEAGPRIEAALVRGLAVRHDQRTSSPAALLQDLSGAAPPERRMYSGDEVQEIVKRASELEATRTQSGAMTIGGVEALARDVGIPTEIVREAARGVRRAEPAPLPAPAMKRNPWINGPTMLAFERVIEGELPESEFPALVEEIRRALRVPGHVAQFGRSFSWTVMRTQGAPRDLEISVVVRAGRTTIDARESLGNLIGATFGGICGGMGGGGLGPIMGIMGGALRLPGALMAVAVPVWLATAYQTARIVYGKSSRKRATTLSEVVDRLAALSLEMIGEQSRGRLGRPVDM